LAVLALVILIAKTVATPNTMPTTVSNVRAFLIHRFLKAKVDRRRIPVTSVEENLAKVWRHL
jgi:hypothetical protein